MSSRRKSSNPCVLRATCSNAEDSLEKDVSEAVLDRYSPVAPTTDESWTSLNNEQEKQPKGDSASEQSLVHTRNHGDHADLLQPEDQGDFRTEFDSLSCCKKVSQSDESCFKFSRSQSVLKETVEHEKEGSLQETQDTKYDLGQCVHSSSSAAGDDAVKIPMENNSILEKGLQGEKELDSPRLKDKIRAVKINGTIIIPEPTCHVTPLLQRPPNLSTSPTIAVPLHTSKYNPILDSNTTLITSFNRFPYPTHAELSWLTAASKHPQEQIKVWFTTQRLKQGITWSPEEVEEARKKMFNGSIPPTHQTCAISPVGEPLKPRQAAFQVLARNSLASNSTATLSVTACTSGNATAVRQTVKRSGTPLLASEVKQPVVPPIGDSRECLRMPPPLAPPPERLAIASSPGLSETRTSSPASLVASETVKRPVAAHVDTPKEKIQVVQSKEMIPVSLTSVLPKERLPLSPIVSTNLKRSLIQINNHTLASSSVPKNKFPCFGNGATMSSAPGVTTPQVSRPTIIQSLAAVPLSPLFQCKSAEPSVPSMVPCFSSQNGKEIPYVDGKHWFLDQTTNSQNSCVEFALRESSVPTHFPLLERVKDKSPGQMKLLEESFQRNSFPSFNEVEHLMISTRLSREEIESWFLERRALRDDLEQALLNSMGSKRESQQTLLNGAQKRSGTLTFSHVPQDSKSMNLLKNVFVQSRWASPVEFRHLEMQTCLARTELVRWFRDSRLAQQSCILDRKEMFGERNGCRTADTTKHPCPKERPLREENTKPSSPAMEMWFDNTLGQHTGSNGEVIPEGRGSSGGWNTRGMLSDSD